MLRPLDNDATAVEVAIRVSIEQASGQRLRLFGPLSHEGLHDIWDVEFAAAADVAELCALESRGPNVRSSKVPRSILSFGDLPGLDTGDQRGAKRSSARLSVSAVDCMRVISLSCIRRSTRRTARSVAFGEVNFADDTARPRESFVVVGIAPTHFRHLLPGVSSRLVGRRCTAWATLGKSPRRRATLIDQHRRG